jgi:putative DNA primase/helicase
MAWAAKGFPAPRPLYNLPDLFNRLDVPVLVVEGEKAADAAAMLFPDLIVTTPPHGAMSPGKADWSVVKGREVIVWPDHDDAGAGYAHAVARICEKAGAASVAIVNVPTDFPAKWDLADATPEGWTAERLWELLKEARLCESDLEQAPEYSSMAEPQDTDDSRRNPPMPSQEESRVNQAEIHALIERSKIDPGAPFEPTARSQLAQLYQDDRPQFERLRLRLKEETRVRVGELDGVIRRPLREEPTSVSGTSLEWNEIEPWPDSVDGAALLDEIITIITSFLVLPAHGAEVMALWIAFAHTLNVWSISPRLAFVSPEKRCGKTTALSIMQQMVPKPLPASNITAAAVFRSIELVTPTLLIDEADTFLRNSDELRGILNSGHCRAQAFVVRTVGDDHTPARFCTWAPVVIAMIGNLPDTLSDRSIVVPLQRKKPEDHVDRFRLDRVEQFDELRRKFARWTKDKHSALGDWDGDAPRELHDRAADNWRPLLAIADVVGGNWPQAARQIAWPPKAFSKSFTRWTSDLGRNGVKESR